MSDYAKQLDAIALAEAKLKAKRFRTLEKALKSDSPDDMVKANQIINAIQNKEKTEDPKAFFIDPLQFNANLGYKDKAFSLTYTTLKRMSKTPIINSIIKTRKNQVADFADYNYLSKYGETYYRPVEGAELTQNRDTEIKSGYLEMANVQIVSEMVNLISITRAYESNQKVIQTFDNTLEVAVTQLGRV